ncbi:hypothetical protein R4I97_09810 [Brachyspira pilosicoli]|uniref:periplasmic flagellar collar protein FlcA n=1 Tax=Brachyspira pilosicoli TaxID=52584 RepID=UPI003006204F
MPKIEDLERLGSLAFIIGNKELPKELSQQDYNNFKSVFTDEYMANSNQNNDMPSIDDLDNLDLPDDLKSQDDEKTDLDNLDLPESVDDLDDLDLPDDLKSQDNEKTDLDNLDLPESVDDLDDLDLPDNLENQDDEKTDLDDLDLPESVDDLDDLGLPNDLESQDDEKTDLDNLDLPKDKELENRINSEISNSNGKLDTNNLDVPILDDLPMPESLADYDDVDNAIEENIIDNDEDISIDDLPGIEDLDDELEEEIADKNNENNSNLDDLENILDDDSKDTDTKEEDTDNLDDLENILDDDSKDTDTKEEDTDNLDDLENILDDDSSKDANTKEEDTDNLDDLENILDDDSSKDNNTKKEDTDNLDDLDNVLDNENKETDIENTDSNLMVGNVAGNVRIVEEENSLPSPDSADNLPESKYEDVDKDINDDEVIDNIKRLSPITRHHVLDAILNEKLSKNSMQKLLKALEKGESNEYITDFINNELGLSISDSRGGLLDIIPIPNSLKEYAKIIRIAAIFLVLFVGIVLFSYQFIYKPVLANKYFKTGLENIYSSQFDEAERNFAKGDRLTPKKVKWYNKYAKEYTDRFAFSYALKKLETSVDINPRNIDTRLLFGYYYRTKGEKELSKEDYDSGEDLYNNLMSYTDKEKDLKRIYDDLGVLMISRAKTLVEPNYYDNAYENYREMINRFGDNVIPRKRVMLIKIYQDNYQDVKDLQNHINRLKSGYIDDEVYPKLAKYLLDKDDFYGARKLFEKLLSKYTNNLESIVGYADYEARLKHYDRAKEILINSALPIYSSNPYNVGEEYVYNMLGQIYYNLKEYGSAINNFKLALEKNSLYPDANFNLANLYFYQDNDYKKAKEHYKIAYDNLAPDLRSDQLLYNLSWIHYLDEEYDLAFQGFNDLFYKNPDNSIVSYALGNSLLHLDRANLANGFYRNALNKALESRRDKLEMRTEKDFMFISYLASLHNNIGVSYAYNSVVSNQIENEQMAFKNFVIASEYFDQLRTSNIDLDMNEKRTVTIDNQNIGASKYNMMAIQSKRNLKDNVIIDDYIPKTMFNLN